MILKKQRAFFPARQLQIFADHFTKTIGQYHAAVLVSLFFHPQGAARQMDIPNIYMAYVCQEIIVSHRSENSEKMLSLSVFESDFLTNHAFVPAFG
ncbi:MAG: hypothetical protein DSY90_09150 [Deltaproteobacteria bacterium]|nr:MAG: hypothetical protein DSY90_09150 [Deltaproteobacteria bacterium]